MTCKSQEQFMITYLCNSQRCSKFLASLQSKAPRSSAAQHNFVNLRRRHIIARMATDYPWSCSYRLDWRGSSATYHIRTVCAKREARLNFRKTTRCINPKLTFITEKLRAITHFYIARLICSSLSFRMPRQTQIETSYRDLGPAGLEAMAKRRYRIIDTCILKLS